jgi:hypothetical protein
MLYLLQSSNSTDQANHRIIKAHHRDNLNLRVNKIPRIEAKLHKVYLGSLQINTYSHHFSSLNFLELAMEV